MASQVRNTINLITYYRRFLRSDCTRMVQPESGWMRTELSKDEARRRLHFLVNVAINRRAGIPDEQGRKQRHEYQIEQYRDCQAVRECVQHRRIVRQFATRVVRERFGHLLHQD